MPIYDFECRECGGVSEIFFRHDGQVPSCMHCGGGELKRRISASNVIKSSSHGAGKPCCGREERCDTAPCAGEGCQCQ